MRESGLPQGQEDPRPRVPSIKAGASSSSTAGHLPKGDGDMAAQRLGPEGPLQQELE